MAVPHMPILTLPATCILLGQSLSRCVAEPIWSRLTSLVPVSHLLLESARGKRHIVHRRWLNTRPLLHHAAYSWNRMRGGTLVDPVTYGPTISNLHSIGTDYQATASVPPIHGRSRFFAVRGARAVEFGGTLHATTLSRS
ncbi:hypothetical protein C8J57DRAFT_1665824 [Mycena rebaudengoi]|nr:hypothetical protein C8J57DRAFT_1665824 [Mycena rebaudengoi]